MAPSKSTNSKQNASSTGMNISDDDLLELSVKDLNKLLKSLSPENRTKLKRRRRILKNRGYAANCRTKRLSQKEILQIEKEDLEKYIKNVKHQNEILKLKLDSIKDRYNDLQHYTNVLKTSSTKN
jgi:transcription factor MAFF/G/K